MVTIRRESRVDIIMVELIMYIPMYVYCVLLGLIEAMNKRLSFKAITEGARYAASLIIVYSLTLIYAFLCMLYSKTCLLDRVLFCESRKIGHRYLTIEVICPTDREGGGTH